jgi:hypothetical protein
MSPENQSVGFSQAAFTQWEIRWLLSVLCGFGDHLIEWHHDEGCPLNQVTNAPPQIASLCRCSPAVTLVVNIGTSLERRIPVIRDGALVPAVFRFYPRHRAWDVAARPVPVTDHEAPRRSGKRQRQ